MRKSFFINEEMFKYFPIYEEAISHIYLCNCIIPNFFIYEENLIFFFFTVIYSQAVVRGGTDIVFLLQYAYWSYTRYFSVY
jgi:hypothetical protein